MIPCTLDELRAMVRAEVQAVCASLLPAPTLSAPLVDKRACALALGVSPATIDRLVAAGRAPFVRVGDHRRFDVSAVRAALETTVAVAPSPAKSLRVPGVRLLSRAQRAIDRGAS